jgi:hypothetical protein
MQFSAIRASACRFRSAVFTRCLDPGQPSYIRLALPFPAKYRILVGLKSKHGRGDSTQCMFALSDDR